MAKCERIWPGRGSLRAHELTFSELVRVHLARVAASDEETYTSIAQAAGISTEQCWRFLNCKSKLTLANFDRLVRVSVVDFKLFEIKSR